MGFGDTFNFYTYISDNGNTYTIKASAQEASAGGLQGPAAPPPTGIAWPWKRKNLRHVWGKAATGQRTRLTVYSNTNTLYQSGGTFTLTGRSYTVEGAIGERRPNNAIA